MATVDEYEIEQRLRVLFDEGTYVLVTGAGGFIGRNLCYYLAVRGALVVGTDIAPGPYPDGMVQWLNWDVRDAEAMRSILVTWPFKYVFHLAALSQVTDVSQVPDLAFDTNARGTAVLLEAVRRTSPETRVIVSTSDKVYGPMAVDEEPMLMSRPLRPRHPYDVSKAAADMVAQCYADFYGMDVVIPRMCNVYGPGDDNMRRIVPSVLNDILRERPPQLRSNGQQVREYIYLTDALDALVGYAVSPIKGPINLGGQPATALDICAILSAEMADLGHPVYPPVILDQDTKETDRIALASPLSDGYAPKIADLKTGLGMTARWAHEMSRDEDEEEEEGEE